MLKCHHRPVTTITSWLVSGQYEMWQAPTAFLKSLWAFSLWHLQYKKTVLPPIPQGLQTTGRANKKPSIVHLLLLLTKRTRIGVKVCYWRKATVRTLLEDPEEQGQCTCERNSWWLTCWGWLVADAQRSQSHCKWHRRLHILSHRTGGKTKSIKM